MVALLKEVLENRAIQGRATNGKKNVISDMTQVNYAIIKLHWFI